MSIYTVNAEITKVHSFQVEANTAEEAKEKYKMGDSIIGEAVDITHFYYDWQDAAMGKIISIEKEDE